MNCTRRWRRLLVLAWLAAAVAQAGAASPPPEQAVQERALTGASAHPAAAWHHLLLARAAAREGERASAVVNYRLAASLDPDLLPAWLGLAALGFPSDPALIGQATTGALQALHRSWEAQRRVLATIVPALWIATTIAATLLLAGIGLRHLPRRRHVLLEGFRPHLGPGRAGAVASLLCIVPLAVQWGFAAAASAYAGLAQGAATRREKNLALLALLWILVMPGVWKLATPYAAPIDPDGLPWLIGRVERETPTPELADAVLGLDARAPGPESAFAVGMLQRRSGHLSDAARAFEKALGPETAISSHAAVNMGNLRLWTGDPTGAARTYESMLDSPDARLEARYNLAIALSRLHRFEEADQRLEEASRLDFDRVRMATKSGGVQAASEVMDGQLGAKELWSLERAQPRPAAPVPPFLSWLHPGGRSTATPLAIVAALVLGAIAGKILEKRLRVHSCTRCGGPVCRRCVTRTAGRSYCTACAASLTYQDSRDHSRLLLRRVLGEERLRGDRLREWATILSPGFGLILRGRTASGGLLTWTFVFGCVLLTGVAWAYPSSVATEGLQGIARALGLFLMIVSSLCSVWMARRLLRQRSLRRFLERDVYRMAA